jgi:hypothetical protein
MTRTTTRPRPDREIDCTLQGQSGVNPAKTTCELAPEPALTDCG